MWTLIVVFDDPGIKIFLQLRDRAVELLAECNAVELIEQRLVEALANAVRLRAPRLSARVIDFLSRDRAHIRGARATAIIQAKGWRRLDRRTKKLFSKRRATLPLASPRFLATARRRARRFPC